MIGLVAMVIFGITHAVRRHRRRGYKQVETDILLYDMDGRDSNESLNRL